MMLLNDSSHNKMICRNSRMRGAHKQAHRRRVRICYTSCTHSIRNDMTRHIEQEFVSATLPAHIQYEMISYLGLSSASTSFTTDRNALCRISLSAALSEVSENSLPHFFVKSCSSCCKSLEQNTSATMSSLDIHPYSSHDSPVSPSVRT